MKLRPAIIYEDNEVMVSYTPEEFTDTLGEYLSQGKTLKQAMDLIIKDLKRKTITA